MVQLNRTRMASNGDSLRLLFIKHNSTELSLLIPIDLWYTAEQLRDQFLLSSDLLEENENENQQNQSQNEITEFQLLTLFCKFTLEKQSDSTELRLLPFLRVLFFYLRDEFLSKNDVHMVASQQPNPSLILQVYFNTLTMLRNNGLLFSDDCPPSKSGLLTLIKNSKASALAIFGGQGNTDDYFQELTDLYQTYGSFLKDFIKEMAQVIKKQATEKDAIRYHSEGFNLSSWLESPETRPNAEYLINAPVSLPLIGLTQLCHYYVLLKVLDKTPEQMKYLFSGTTGHSQGIISSIVISAASTFDEFYDYSRKAIHLLFWLGLRSQQSYPTITLNPEVVTDSITNGEGMPTPMLAITNLRVVQVCEYVEATNNHLPKDKRIYVGLINGPRSVVVSGPPLSLYGLNVTLRKLKSEPGLDQTRVPFSKRKTKFSSRFLPITVPFHSPYLSNVTSLVLEDCRDKVELRASELDIPVFCSCTGNDVRKETELMSYVIDLICVNPVKWTKATECVTTHILDFGPGGISGIGSLTQRNKEGTGVQVILVGSNHSLNSELLTKVDLVNADEKVKFAPNWSTEFRPNLMKTKDGQVYVDTRFSRMLGKPHIMVAGMTPTSTNATFVSGCINAGFHVELAGGGQYSESMFKSTISDVMNRIQPGEGISVNILFLNARQWAFQYPLILKMRSEGIPLEGVCVAAGVPSAQVADDIIKNMISAGIKHVSFKPSSVDTIRQVISIAKNNPTMPVILQWTGGRAGGHHSYEDFHNPILETYASIRRQHNLILVGGSGFGDADGSFPYLTGEWSLKFDYPEMPFDGILFGSRMLVAAESLASDSIKQLIVDAPGIEEQESWELTYDRPVGGVVTVKSELGEPIHKIATRGIMLWKELDETLFSLPKDKRREAVIKRKDEIIRRLNADYQKVWFGRKSDGRVAELGDMTYAEVIERLQELLYIKHKSRWIHESYKQLLVDFMKRVEERFCKIEDVSISDADPYFVKLFLSHYTKTHTQLLTTEDVLYFITLCQRRGQKPVPFIPVLDEHLSVWFKRDSLWLSEDIDAVIDQDPQRVCILQGPVAVKYSTVVNEPVKSILGNINSRHIECLLQKYYSGVDVPLVEYVSNARVDTVIPRGVTVTSTNNTNVYTLSNREQELPELLEWLNLLGGSVLGGVCALLTCSYVVQNSDFIDNPVKRIMRPRVGQVVEVGSDKNRRVVSITVYAHGRNVVEINNTDDTMISVNLSELNRNGKSIVLPLLFQYIPSQGYSPIHEVMQGRNDRIKLFYSLLWFGDKSALQWSIGDKFISTECATREQINQFCQAIGNQAELYVTEYAPMDYAIVLGWKSVIKALFPSVIDGDLTRLVHLSNGFRVLNKHSIRQDDVIRTEAEINSILISDSGKSVKVKGIMYSEDTPIMEITSTFLYRGKYTDYSTTFSKTNETPMQMILTTTRDVAVLKSKEWIQWIDTVDIHCKLVFRCHTFVQYKDKRLFSRVVTSGSIELITTRDTILVGRVEYEYCGESSGNPVMEYLKRSGKPIEQAIPLSPVYSIVADSTDYSPLSNDAYARVSGDVNPIHLNPYFSDLAQLPAPITHGMWTSASTRKFVEIFASGNDPTRVTMFECQFVGMVLPGTRLDTRMTHVGMRNGKKLISVDCFDSTGKVLTGIAEVEQPTIGYVFTGQGSQEVGMGMDLYNSSTVARELWDRADKHILEYYGFSIIDIVKNNPRERTVYFGGPQGEKIKRNYQSMTYVVQEMDGSTSLLPLFPTITDTTQSYTFMSPNGLLYATQFTQPALTLVEVASFHDMKHNGLVQEHCVFAGHSLGEYAALASIGNVLPIESLVDVVFYRGMTMQVAVPRDSTGRSNYGMCAVNPSRVGVGFGEEALEWIVGLIRGESGVVLEIVNYNVENWQYVVAGSLDNLDVLGSVLDVIHVMKSMDHMMDMIKKARAESEERKRKNGGVVVLVRGLATIPLAGIDVPFHSSFLLQGVPPFRDYLASKISSRFINVELLIGKYVPNLTARVFTISKDYFEYVYSLTHSATIAKVLDTWHERDLSLSFQKQFLGYTLLVELLAYQFASPVRWIETQDVLFKEYKVERLIEVGPAPILCGMANRTLKFKYEAYDDALTLRRANLCYFKDSKEIYYKYEDVVEEIVAESEAKEKVQVVSSPLSNVAAVAVAVSDEPISVHQVIHVMVAHKLKKSLSLVPLSKSIKDLSNGKSTIQNEILGDMQKEFGNILPEKGEEDSLQELADSISPKFTGSLGKVTSGLIAAMISSKLTGGFGLSRVKAHMSSKFGLGPNRTDAALLHGLTCEPSSRLGSEAETRAWLDEVAEAYASKVGITLGNVAVGSGNGGAVVSAVSSEELVAMQLKSDNFVRQQLELYSRYLGDDLRKGHRLFETERLALEELNQQLDLWMNEHGQEYANGIKPLFDLRKVRVFDSYWNWARQDSLELYYDIIFDRLKSVNRDVTGKSLHVMNRTDNVGSLLATFEYYIGSVDTSRGETYQRAKDLGEILIKNMKEVAGKAPVYKDLSFPVAPQTMILESGEIAYAEVVREGVTKMENYVKEMRFGSDLTAKSGNSAIRQEMKELLRFVQGNEEAEHVLQRVIKSVAGDVELDRIPFLHLNSRKEAGSWTLDTNQTNEYLNVLAEMATEGITFAKKKVLVTGCGKGSIGVELVKGLLSGGAKVVVTTSRFCKSVTEFYRSIYERHGAKGSTLIVMPFNQGSKKDIETLVDYIYELDCRKGLRWDLDYIIPFAAVPENGREISEIDGRSELAHRIMLTNVLRLLGCVKTKKQQLGYNTRPAQVLLPLSPNHGTFGGDGLYGESKIALETLMNRWKSESWSSYLTIMGAVIGWTRGTGLMSGNNMVAQGIEKLGVRTFSTQEMAFNILGLMHPKIVKLCEHEPVWADLNGGLQFVDDLNEVSKKLRKELTETSTVRQSVAKDNALDEQIVKGVREKKSEKVTPRANLTFDFPSIDLPADASKLKDMLDLEKVVVVTGYGEVGPYGNARTRWQMEAYGEFSLEGCIEMAWMMGYIKHHHGPLKNGDHYSGWVDCESKMPVKDIEIKRIYEERILNHTGIRLIEPELFDGYDPKKKMFLQEVAIDEDMNPIEVSEEQAQEYKMQHGEFADVYELTEGQWVVKLRKGATLFVPKALSFDRLVAGQIPTGWNAVRYGVPEDIVNQVDPVTLYVIVSSVEALISSGITDPYEFYEYIHVTELGNTSGGGVGGMKAFRGLFRERLLDNPVQNDILQESFINTMPAWVNMLLLSSSGPIKTPVGACATAVESVEIGVDTILSGKAKVVLVGGYDDFQEEGSYEFANMKATSNAVEEIEKGREPKEMSRPATTTRGGFMEAQGAGIQVLMNAKLAVEMGVPIYGIVACTNTATDKQGRSVPAPGQGILTTARQVSTDIPPPFMSIDYRRRQLQKEREFIKRWIGEEIELLDVTSETFAFHVSHIRSEANRLEKAALAKWSHDFYKQSPFVSPLSGALATFGLTVDDIGVASFHGTGTKANDLNESEVVNTQMTHLGRSKGNMLPAIFQKYLTGHPKGAAAAWMLNGALQCLNTGLIPGNRNADNIDRALQEFEYILYPSRSIQTDGIKAAVVKSFGFGQVGGEVLVIHPSFVYSCLSDQELAAYKAKREKRQATTYRYLHESLTEVGGFVRVKTSAPYTKELQTQVYLNPLARAQYDHVENSWKFDAKSVLAKKDKQVGMMEMVLKEAGNVRGVGVDVQLTKEVNVENETFVERNFTQGEIDYARSQPCPQSSFAARWAAKEAVIKAISNMSDKSELEGAAAPLVDIEVVRREGEAPEIVLHGEAKRIAEAVGVNGVKVSMSHSGEYAVAVAYAN